MVASLTVKSISKINKDKFSEKSFELEQQTELEDFGFENVNLGLPKTTVNRMHIEGNWIYYKVSMNTDTIKEPILVYWEDLEHKEFREINKGYQKVLNFNFSIKKDFSEIRIFSARLEANLLLKRLRREDYLHCKHTKFNFKQISEIKDMECAWGVWEDHNGIERKRARFGKGINEIIDEKEYDSITTVYMDYIYGGETVQLIVSIDGRISSKSKSITEKDIAIIYDELKSILS